MCARAPISLYPPHPADVCLPARLADRGHALLLALQVREARREADENRRDQSSNEQRLAQRQACALCS